MTHNGIMPELDIPAPTDKAGVQRFLGMVGYVHKFIPNMSESAKPLRTLLGKDVEWQFEQKKSFEELKKQIKNSTGNWHIMTYINISQCK